MAEAVTTGASIRRRWIQRPVVREGITGWLFAMPWVLGFLIFTAGPMLFSLYASFTRYNIIAAPRWVGLRNYSAILEDERFYISLQNTFWLVAVKVPVVVVISIAIALLLDMDLPGGKLFRTIFYLPSILAGAAAIFLWRWILLPDGLLNRGLALFGIDGPAWFFDPRWTKPGLVVMGLWWIGGNILIYLASLKGIPSQLYEAAAIDGASGLKKVWYITLPMLSPTIFFQVVTGIIGAFQIFTSAYIIAGADPSNNKEGPGQSLLFYVLYIYNRAFGRTGQGGFQMGYASALAWILLVIILAITLFQLWLSRRWVYYETEGR